MRVGLAAALRAPGGGGGLNTVGPIAKQRGLVPACTNTGNQANETEGEERAQMHARSPSLNLLQVKTAYSAHSHVETQTFKTTTLPTYVKRKCKKVF